MGFFNLFRPKPTPQAATSPAPGAMPTAQAPAPPAPAAPKDLGERLRKAILSDDIAAALRLIGLPGNHHLEADADGWMPLHCAATNGSLEVAIALLGKGAPAGARDAKNRWTPLHHAMGTAP